MTLNIGAKLNTGEAAQIGSPTLAGGVGSTGLNVGVKLGVLPEPAGDNEFINTLSDFGQAVSNPVDLIGGTMRAGFEQAIGGFQQKFAERQIIDATRGLKPLRTFAGITEDDPLANAEGYQAGMKALQDSAQAGQDLYAEGKALDAGLREAFPQKSYLGGIARGVTSSIGFQLPTMAAAIINPALAVPLSAAMFFATSGQKYGERRSDGFDIETSQSDANFHGVTEMLTEAGGAYFMGKFFKAAKEGLPILKPFVKELVSEVVGESAATTLQGSNDFIREDKANKLTDYILSKRHVYDQIDTLASVLMQTGVTGGVGQVLKFDSRRRAEGQIKKIDGLIESLKQSGDAGIELEDGTRISLGELRRSQEEIKKEFGLKLDAPTEYVAPTIEDIQPDMIDIAANVAEMVESPVFSTTEQAANLASRITQLENELTALNIDPVTASPEILEQGSKLQKSISYNKAKYSTLMDDLGGESSSLAEPKIDSIQISNLNLVDSTKIIKDMEDHFANPDSGDSTVYSSPSMLAHGNLVEDLLLSSGIKSKVAVLNYDEIAGSEIKGDLGEAVGRLDVTQNYGVVKRVVDENGASRYIAVVNSKEIAKAGKGSEARLLEATLHEAFGHVVVGERYAWADEATKGALEKDFMRFTKLPADQAIKAFYPLKTGEIAIGLPEGMSERTQFKEWLVNGVVKWSTSEAAPIGLANKWFKKLTDVFKKAFKKEGAEQTPESIRNWMNSMFDASRLVDKVEQPMKIVEPHGGYKKLSIAKQIEKIKGVVSEEELKAYEIGKIEGKDEKTLGVYRKDKDGNKVLVNQFTSSSRSSAQREANLFKYAHALASRGLSEPLSSSGARVKFYRNTLSSFKEEVQRIAEEQGQSFEQTWLDFIGDTNTFSGFVSLKDKYLNMSLPGRKIFDRLTKIAEHNPGALKKAILYEKRVMAKEVQELAKAEEVLKSEIEEATVEQVPIDRIQNSNRNLESRIQEKAIETVEALNKVGSKVNLERITNSVIEKLQLIGKDARDARKYLKENYEDLKGGKKLEAAVLEKIEKDIESQRVPDDVSLEEAAAFMDGLQDMVVYHGSPHKFDKFKLEKIGTGEGAQVYGHGLYFASNRSVAAWYRKQLTTRGKKVQIGDFEYSPSAQDEINTPELKAADALYTTLEDRKAIKASWADSDVYAITINYQKELIGNIRNAISQYTAQQLDTEGLVKSLQFQQKALDIITAWRAEERTLTIVEASKGALYKVELAPQEHEYLDWDKPVGEQPFVNDKLNRIRADLGQDFIEEVEYRRNADLAEWTGSELYKTLERYASEGALPGDETNGGNPAAETSAYLHKLGIRGTKYLDGNSRSRGEGHSNYVIFNDKDVNILETEDMAVRRKSKPITGPLKEKVIKIKKAAKDITPEKASEKIQKRLLKEKEFVEETSKLESAASKANVSLTEYLRAVGKDKEGNPLSEDTIAKIIRKYQRLAKTIFTDQEHILRLGTALGLVDGVTGVAGLEAYVKTIFGPKAQGPIKQLTITGRDILMKRMQDLWLAKEGSKFDFSQLKTFRELVNLSREEHASWSGWKKFKAGLAYYINQNIGELETTPAGSSLAFVLKNVLTAEAALYTRDYPARLQKFVDTVTDPIDREHVWNIREKGETPRNKVFAEYAQLLDEIYTYFGKEGEALSVRVQYKGGFTAPFKATPGYLPHVWEPGSFDKPSEKMINSLLVSGMPVDPKQAAAIIKSHGARATRLAAPKFANLEMAREIEMEGYIKDPGKVTMQYIMHSAKRMALLREVGQQPEVRLAQLAWDHFQQSGDADSYNFAVKVINSVTGVAVHERLMEKSGWLANPLEFAALASTLQHSAFVQPGVLANTLTVAGWKKTVEGMKRYIKADPRKPQMSKEWAQTLGANGRSVTKEMLDEMHDSLSLATKLDKLMNFWRIPQIDTWFRNSATLTGRLHINEMVERSINLGDKKAERELNRLGLSSAKFKELLDANKDELVEDELRKGAYAFAQRTNLVNDALTKAQWTMEHSSFSRMLTLLGRFSFQQHHFLKSLYKDDPKKLVKYLGIATAVGVPGYVAKTLMKGKNPVEDAKERGLFGTWIAMLQNAAGLGMFLDMTLDALTQVTTGKQGHAIDRVGGPIPSLLEDSIRGTSKIAHGDLTSASAMRLLLRSGVVVTAGALPPKYGIPIAGTLGIARPAIETLVKENK